MIMIIIIFVHTFFIYCTVIKLHVVKEAIQSSSSLPFITNFNLFVNAKTLTDFSTYFKDVIQYYYCQSGVRLIVAWFSDVLGRSQSLRFPPSLFLFLFNFIIYYYYLLYRHECFTGKYTTHKFLKLHPGLEWFIFHNLTREFIDDLISVIFLYYFIEVFLSL